MMIHLQDTTFAARAMVRPIRLGALTFLAVPSSAGGADSVRREFWKFGGRKTTVTAPTISASER
jgi:hypothetical protein